MPPMRTIDLSFPLKPHFHWTVGSERRSTHESGAIFQSTVFTASCHAYTHVDAPVHFLSGDRDIAQMPVDHQMPVDQWMGPAAVVDLTHLGDNGEVSAADLERRAGHVERGDIVLLRTDWPLKCAVETERFWREAPFTGRSRVPHESRQDRLAPLSLHRAAPQARGRRWLPCSRHRHRGLARGREISALEPARPRASSRPRARRS